MIRERLYPDGAEPGLRRCAMCESSVFMKEGDAERLVLEDVVLIRSLKGGVYIEDILGRSREVAGRIELIDLVNHRIIITDQ